QPAAKPSQHSWERGQLAERFSALIFLDAGGRHRGGPSSRPCPGIRAPCWILLQFPLETTSGFRASPPPSATVAVAEYRSPAQCQSVCAHSPGPPPPHFPCSSASCRDAPGRSTPPDTQ